MIRYESKERNRIRRDASHVDERDDRQLKRNEMRSFKRRERERERERKREEDNPWKYSM